MAIIIEGFISLIRFKLPVYFYDPKFAHNTYRVQY